MYALQRSLKQSLLSLEFWENFDNIKQHNRTVTIDFFRNSKMVSIIDLILGEEEETQNEILKEEQKKREAAELLAANYDPTKPIKVKRHPELSADLPLPTIPQPPPKHWVPPQPPLPAWLTRITNSNYDPVKGIAVGSAAETPEGWGADRVVNSKWLSSVRSVEAAKAIVQETYPAERAVKYPPPPKGPIAPPVPEEVVRAQELEFIRKARDTLVAKRDNIVTIMNRTAPCELVDRPKPKVRLGSG